MQCSKCILDDINDKDISFDTNGVCNYCLEFESRKKNYTFTELEEKKNIEEIKKKLTNTKSKYHAIIGLSGGVDSSYVCYLAHKMGLNCLLIQMDNGWNSELSQNNIANLVRGLGLDLYTHVIDWDEFKSL